MESFVNYNFENMSEEELFSFDGGVGVVNIVSGVTAIAGVVGTVFPPANIYRCRILDRIWIRTISNLILMKRKIASNS